MMYSQPAALNRETHAEMTLSPSPTGYGFAADLLTVMLVTTEFFDAGRHYPIIFTVTPDKRVVPLALLGLEENENLFVDESGKWDAQYIPAFIRRYPFVTTDGAEGQMTVCFDQAYDGFDLEGGVPLFEDGEPTAKTKEIQAFLQDYFQQMKLSERFGETLQEMGLLKEMTAQASLEDGRKFALNGLQVVDEQKLAELPDTEIVKLFRSGMMLLIHAHLISLRNLGAIVDRKSKRNR
jgi:hypothetical protein